MGRLEFLRQTAYNGLVVKIAATVFVFILSLAINAAAGQWVRSGVNTNEAVWGIRDHLMWALQPNGFRPRGEPRGLIRLGYPILTNGGYDLINFLAVEPIVNGQKGFSELEQSALDKVQGKRLWAVDLKNPASTNLVPGTLTKKENGAEELEVPIRVEAFENGAKVRLHITQRTDRPDEITLKIYPEEGSAAMEYCILTATMGNMARTRELWLANETISSLKLYPSYREEHFAPHTIFSLNRLCRDRDGNILAAITTDEKDPSATYPFPGSRRWYYGGPKVTQYWKKASGSYQDDLQVAVNARYTYWKSRTLIPGGISYENFEMRERFHPGQEFTFGITRRTPAEIGFSVGKR